MIDSRPNLNASALVGLHAEQTARAGAQRSAEASRAVAPTRQPAAQQPERGGDVRQAMARRLAEQSDRSAAQTGGLATQPKADVPAGGPQAAGYRANAPRGTYLNLVI